MHVSSAMCSATATRAHTRGRADDGIDSVCTEVWSGRSYAHRCAVHGQVIAMCEQKAGNEASVTKVPLLSLKALEFVTGFFQWTRDASDRLAFANVLTNNEVRGPVAMREWRAQGYLSTSVHLGAGSQSAHVAIIGRLL